MVELNKTDMQPVGAHYGWREWLAQRVTAVIMAVFAVVIFSYFMLKSDVNYSDWKDLFGSQIFRVLALLFLLVRPEGLFGEKIIRRI